MTTINTWKSNEATRKGHAPSLTIGIARLGESMEPHYDGIHLRINADTWGVKCNDGSCVHFTAAQAQDVIDALQAEVQRIKDNDPTALRKQAFGLFKVVFGDVPAAARHAYTRAVLGMTPQSDASWREGNLTPTQMRHVIRTLQAVCEAEDLVAEVA